jgi:Ca2+/H+ antiporter
LGRGEVGLLFLGVLICADGQSNWCKGVRLVTLHAIIALMFSFMPEVGP